MTSTNETGLTNAVRINSSVSQKLYGRPIFESVTLWDVYVQKMMRPSAPHDQASQIARRIGTPLRAYLEHRHERSDQVRMDWSYAVFLHMSCKLDTKQDSINWGWASDYWKMNSGDAYVIREDGKPLCPRLLEVLCAWCYQELQPKFQIAMEEYYDRFVDKRKDVLALITKENFEAYKEKFEREGKTADYGFDDFDFASAEEVYEEILRTGQIQDQNASAREKTTTRIESRAAYLIR
ncbi:unnamed protein product [Aureobasidium mustum]|uniref:Uncharacterized protein n=1 Tax=Aureobasidium mustum TaxID=2773714 RepID=A0A9N8K9F5_9PEZI|nr:unnamed protein product [Aureobasidium mustum]